jgi:NAD+ diphosphatase
MLYELDFHEINLPGAVPALTGESRIILWSGHQVVLNERDISWPYERVRHDVSDIEFVGVLNGKHYFTGLVSESFSSTTAVSLRDITFIGETQFMLCGRARAHLDWRIQHRFCSQCGTAVSQVTSEFAMQCESCRLRFYPRISPCIIVLITRGEEVLLAQGEKNKEQGWYSTLAGFIESGESAEQAVIREVKEEVNVDITNIRYLNSQAWPFPNQLMLGYEAEYSGGEIIPAPGEIADAQWFNINDLPKTPPSISIAGWMLRVYKDRINRT